MILGGDPDEKREEVRSGCDTQEERSQVACAPDVCVRQGEASGALAQASFDRILSVCKPLP